MCIRDSICYVLGLIFGKFFFDRDNTDQITSAYNQGLEGGKREAEVLAETQQEKKKEELTSELYQRMLYMRHTLVASFQAYEETLKSIDDQLSSKIRSELSLEKAQLSTNEEAVSIEPTTDKKIEYLHEQQEKKSLKKQPEVAA